MSRPPGFDKTAKEQREKREDTSFNLRLIPDELAFIKLRIEQALRRKPELADLLYPALDNAKRIEDWLNEIGVSNV